MIRQQKEEQTKTYQKILQEQQNEIDQLERNCDVFNEQMNDAVERTIELNEKIYNAEKMIKRDIKDLKEVLNELGLGDDKNE